LSEFKTILLQIKILARASLKARYRNSVLGYLWVLISPLSTYLAQAYVFKVVFKVQIDNYFLFLLLGLVPWMFFAQTLEMTTTSLFYSSRLLKAIPVHPVSLIMAQVLDNLINNFTVILIVLAAISSFETVPFEKLYLFPLPYFVLVVFTLSLSFLFSLLSIKYFDVKFVVSFVLGLLFFISPILYPENFVPEETQFLLALNPMYFILRPFRVLVEYGASVEFFRALFIASCGTLAAALTAYTYWKTKRNEIYLRL
jgi:lipopolysaccharide transport system permease protein